MSYKITLSVEGEEMKISSTTKFLPDEMLNYPEAFFKYVPPFPLLGLTPAEKILPIEKEDFKILAVK